MLSFREKVFTPAALGAHHRSLIYKKSRHPILLNDPGVTVTMANDEEIKLRPMERWDKPNKRRSLRQIADILGRSHDHIIWGNLIPFLEGMKQSHEKVPDSFLEKITRKANEVGKAGIIIRCAEMAGTTGVSLGMPAVTRELFLGCHNRSADAGFKGPVLEKAAAQAEHMSLMLEEKVHCGGDLNATGRPDMRRSPTVLGVLLEMAAAKAQNTAGGKDIDGKVASYVIKSLALTHDGVQDSVLTLTDREGSAAELDSSSRHLENLLPLWNGLKLASQVDGITESKIGAELSARLQTVEQEVQAAAEKVKRLASGKPRRALQMYEQLQR